MMKRFLDSKTIWNIGNGFLVVSALAVIFSRTIADPDLWGHLRFGLDTLRAGAIIQHDPYSYLTAGERWINHEWLAEALFAFAWLAAGVPGLVLLKMSVAFLTMGYIWKHLVNQGLNRFLVMILLLVASLFFFSFFVVVRPQMFTFLLFTVGHSCTDYFMDKSARRGSCRAGHFGHLDSASFSFSPASMAKVYSPGNCKLRRHTGESLWRRFTCFFATHRDSAPP
jgi:hypothetical protein